jgi:Fe2+ or Zn2+ uptake regulation protein
MRETPLRQSILEIIKNEQQPVSIPKLIPLLEKQNLKPNKTTLYRLFQKLVSSGAVEEVLLDSGTAFYEISSHHHHHFICQNCENIECLSDETLEQSIHVLEKTLQKNGLKLNAHHFSFSGFCKNCTT